MRSFSTKLKTPNWSNIAVGVGKPLTDSQIKRYAKQGRYGRSNQPSTEDKAFSRAVSALRRKDSAAKTIASNYI